MSDMDYYPDIFNMRSVIERFIEQYDGTIIGWETKNRYENSDGSLESLEEIIGYM